MRWLPVAFGFLVLLGANGGGCSQPNVVGVQDYGSVTGRVLDATSNLPIPNALVSVGSLFTASTDGRGGFVMTRVPIGQQTVTVRAAGYTTVTTNVAIVKDQAASIGYARLVPIANPAGMTTLPPPPTPSPTPAPSPSPSPLPTLTP
ncbi:MAG TPA: carboxypeptidase regulatory-like domain-containing protein [Candidatus Tyrphobacter sp.]